MAKNDSRESEFKDIISKSVAIHSGPPAVYQLRGKEEKFGTLTRITVGEKDPKKKNKTILLVGETGAGKSTLINTLFNYSMGVKWEDEIWFHIVQEETDVRGESQTSDVIVYEIFDFEDKTVPYSLTIIDTPGYGNTSGFKCDDIIRERLLDLFRSDDGVHEVHVVGVVMKASDNRLSDRLMYSFDSVMSLFGNDVEKNIVALITHSNGTRPKNALRALKAAKCKCAKNEKNQPVYFLFNNCQHEERREEEEEEEEKEGGGGVLRGDGGGGESRGQEGSGVGVREGGSSAVGEDRVGVRGGGVGGVEDGGEGGDKVIEEAAGGTVKGGGGVGEGGDGGGGDNVVGSGDGGGSTGVGGDEGGRVGDGGGCRVGVRGRGLGDGEEKEGGGGVLRGDGGGGESRGEGGSGGGVRGEGSSGVEEDGVGVIGGGDGEEGDGGGKVVEQVVGGNIGGGAGKAGGGGGDGGGGGSRGEVGDGGGQGVGVREGGSSAVVEDRGGVRGGGVGGVEDGGEGGDKVVEEAAGGTVKGGGGVGEGGDGGGGDKVVGSGDGGGSTGVGGDEGGRVGDGGGCRVGVRGRGVGDGGEKVEQVGGGNVEGGGGLGDGGGGSGDRGGGESTRVGVIGGNRVGVTEGRISGVAEDGVGVRGGVGGVEDGGGGDKLLEGAGGGSGDRGGGESRRVGEGKVGVRGGGDGGDKVVEGGGGVGKGADGRGGDNVVEQVGGGNVEVVGERVGDGGGRRRGGDGGGGVRGDEGGGDKISKKGIKELMAFLTNAAPQKLKITAQVLDERIRLTACIQNLQERINLTELKRSEIRQIKETLQEHEEEMKKNKEFTVEIDEVYKEKQNVKSGTKWLIFYEGAVTCSVCEENCHYPGCTNAWKPQNCEVMRGGRCTVCTKKCPASDHVKEKWIYVIKTRRVQKTIEDINEKYGKYKSESENKLSLLENLEKELNQLTTEKSQLLDESYQHIVRLEQLALKADTWSTIVHLDFLIEKLKEKGDTEKVQKLEVMRSRVDEGTRAALRK